MFACTVICTDIFSIISQWVITQEYAVNEAMVNNFVGLFIIFLPRVVLFRVATMHITCVVGVLRGGKGKRRAYKAREDHGTFSLLCSFSLSFLPFYGLPHRLLCIMLLLPQNNYVLGCLKCCYHDHQMQKR